MDNITYHELNNTQWDIEDACQVVDKHGIDKADFIRDMRDCYGQIDCDMTFDAVEVLEWIGY